MSELLPVPRHSLTTRLERSTARALDRVQADAALATARQTAKLEIIADVTEAAMLATSHVSSMEALLIARTPHAEARLRHIADTGTLGLAAVVAKTARTLP